MFLDARQSTHDPRQRAVPAVHQAQAGLPHARTHEEHIIRQIDAAIAAEGRAAGDAIGAGRHKNHAAARCRGRVDGCLDGNPVVHRRARHGAVVGDIEDWCTVGEAAAREKGGRRFIGIVRTAGNAIDGDSCAQRFGHRSSNQQGTDGPAPPTVRQSARGR